MHLDILVRGDLRILDRFFNKLFSIGLKYKSNDIKDGKFIKGTSIDNIFQVSVRKNFIGYEIIFPEEHKDLMLTSILGKPDGDRMNERGKAWLSWMNKYIFVLRLITGLKPIPKYKTDKDLKIDRRGMEIVAIGLKYDTRDAEGHENL